jgi:hypothetical protein
VNALLTVSELAKWLNVSEDYIYRNAKALGVLLICCPFAARSNARAGCEGGCLPDDLSCSRTARSFE